MYVLPGRRSKDVYLSGVPPRMLAKLINGWGRRLDLSQKVRMLAAELSNDRPPGFGRRGCPAHEPAVYAQPEEKDVGSMNTLPDDQLLTIVTNVVAQNGCRLVDIDFDNHILNIEGSEEDRARCALALEEVLG